MTAELSNFTARWRTGFLSTEGTVTDGLLDGVQNAGDQAHREDDVFNRLACELFALQFAHNAPYRKFCEARGITPQEINDWRSIPAIPTTAFKEWDLSCLSREERTTVFHSSGTTEHRPSRHFHSAESLAIYQASLRSWFRVHVPSGGRILILTPTVAEVPHSSLVHMFDVIRQDEGQSESVFVGRVAGNGSWVLDFEAAMQLLKSANNGTRRLLVLGTAFSFVHLLDHLAEQKVRFQLPPGSILTETGGYKGRSRAVPKTELHALMTKCLGIPAANILCEYGMSELSSQAYDREMQNAECRMQNAKYGARGDARLFRFPPWVRTQIISPETGCEVAEGETGLLRVFDLANIFSVMAVQTEDLAIRRGSGFELIGRAQPAEPRGCSLMATADSALPIPHSALE